MFNAAATVAATLASVRSLEGMNWHCIVINDGSTDDAAGAQLVRAIQDVDPRFTLLSKANGGLSSTRNAGLDYLRDNPAHQGEHILLLDADDELIAPGMQELLRQAAGKTGQTKHDTSLAGNFEIINAAGRLLRNQTIPTARIDLVQLLDLPMLVPNCLLHRWHDIAGHRFSNSRRKIEDYDLYFRMALAGVVWTAIDVPIARYRISENSMSHDFGACLRDGQAVIAEAFAATRAARKASPAHEPQVDSSAERELAVLGKQALNWSTREAVCIGRIAEAAAMLAAATGTLPAGADFLAGCVDSAVLLGLGITPESEPTVSSAPALAATWRNVKAWCTALEQLKHFAPGLASRLPPLLDVCAQDKPQKIAELLAEALRRMRGTENLTSLTVFGYGTIGKEFVKQAQRCNMEKSRDCSPDVTIFIRDTRLVPANAADAAMLPPGTELQAWEAPLDTQTLCIVTINEDESFLTRHPLSTMEPSRLLRWAEHVKRNGADRSAWTRACATAAQSE